MPVTDSVAVAVFVKTPGLSEIKSRLRVGLSSWDTCWDTCMGARAAQSLAGEFYQRSVQATRSFIWRAVQECPQVKPYWAIAESQAEGRSEWESFPRVLQGDGGLGDRLSRVYGELLKTHQGVILLGADCPWMTSTHLINAAHSLREAPFVLAPALDGGFVLFGGRQPISPELWRSVPYSSSETTRVLLASLEGVGQVTLLPGLRDVDTEEDFRALQLQSEGVLASSEFTPEQKQLAEWMRSLRRSKTGLSD